MLNKSSISIIVLLIVCCRHPAHAVGTPREFSIALCSLLSYSVTGINPVGVDINRRAQIIDIRLECLAADFALEIADTRLLLDGHADGVLVIAEEALEGCGQLLLLWKGVNLQSATERGEGEKTPKYDAPS